MTPLVLPDPSPTANGRSPGSRPLRNPNHGLELLATPNADGPGKSLWDDTDPRAEIRRGRGDDDIELLGDALATLDNWFRIGIEIGADPT